MFEALKLTKNVDFDKYGYNDYGIIFDAFSRFSWADGTWGKNVWSWFMHLDNNKRYPKQRLANTTITSEAKYPINFI